MGFGNSKPLVFILMIKSYYRYYRFFPCKTQRLVYKLWTNYKYECTDNILYYCYFRVKDMPPWYQIFEEPPSIRDQDPIKVSRKDHRERGLHRESPCKSLLLCPTVTFQLPTHWSWTRKPLMRCLGKT